MEFLTSGVLQNLLREMSMGEKGKEHEKPFLLQIRSIIPVLTEGDLWPNQGFYLKVSDSSHTMYVSLPQEQDDMVLCNKLRLGQLIYVDRLESSYPVPTIVGINPIPGQYPCLENPEDLVVPKSTVSDSMSKLEGKDVSNSKRPPKGRRSSSASKVRSCKNATVKMCCDDSESDVKKGIQECQSSFVDITISTSSRQVKRRSWTSREIFDANNAKLVLKSSARSRSANTSPLRPRRYNTSEDSLNSKTKVKYNGSVEKTTRSSNKIKTNVQARSYEKSIDQASMLSLAMDKKMEEAKISWRNLPSTLADHGKEVLRLKEVAMLAAVDVLQEASAAEKILECLSIYSKLQLAKENNQQPPVDKFFDLQTNISQTLLIIQSLKSISPLRENDADHPTSLGSVSKALKLASERKKNATSWIKAALESDLSSFCSPPDPVSKQATNIMKRPNLGLKLKGSSVVRMQRNDRLTSESNLPDWRKGTIIDAATQLAGDLQWEGKKWFLAHVESYLDEVHSKNKFKSDNEVAEMMRQMKKVNDWLDLMMMVERKDGSELEAYGRVREKIYAVLLQNVERTAMALEHISE